MIRIVKKDIVDFPKILDDLGILYTELLKQRFDDGETDFDFDSELYGATEVKDALIEAQDGKCCFCEAYIRHISFGDVEHYRPKKGWIQSSEALNKPGYYWLAYEWDNLFLSCQLCNQRHKRNLFPVYGTRALNHHYDLCDEEPEFVHPSIDNPTDHIEFNLEVPRGKDVKGANTITKLGIDRATLNDNRRHKLGILIDLYKLAQRIPATTPEIQKEAWDTVRKYRNESMDDSCEYASMLRCFFATNPLPPEP